MLLEINHLEKVYRTRFSKEETRALQDVDFKVEEGEFIAIMGESGSGKTTLLNILATLDKPTRGSVILNNQDITKIKTSPKSRKASWQISVCVILALSSKILTSWTPCPSKTISFYLWYWHVRAIRKWRNGWKYWHQNYGFKIC